MAERLTNTFSVVGVQYRKDAAAEFAKNVEKAEKKGLQYGIQIEH